MYHAMHYLTIAELSPFILLDHTGGSTSESAPLFAMSGDGTNDVTIPMVFVFHQEGEKILDAFDHNGFVEVLLASKAMNTGIVLF